MSVSTNQSNVGANLMAFREECLTNLVSRNINATGIDGNAVSTQVVDQVIDRQFITRILRCNEHNARLADMPIGRPAVTLPVDSALPFQPIVIWQLIDCSVATEHARTILPVSRGLENAIAKAVV
jgi:hypothetical protein